MRLLVSATSYFPEVPGGAGRLAYDLAQEFVRQGHEVWLVSQTTDARVAPHILDRGLHVLRYKLAPSNRLDLFRHIRHISATKAVLQQYMNAVPDVIHGNDLLSYVGSLANFRQTEPHTCYSIHSPATEELAIVWKAQGTTGYIKNLLGQPIIRRYERQVLNVSNILTAESNFTRNLVQSIYGRQVHHRIHVIPGWVEPKRFALMSPEQVQAIRKQLAWPVDRPVFFVLRRLEARMGLDRLMIALAELKRDGLDVFTAIAGSGGERQLLENIQHRLGLQSNVRFMGRISDELLPLAYGASDASVIPSRALECFGIIALEAMATGRPALVTPVGALPEVVGTFEPQWVAAGTEASCIAAVLKAFLRRELPLHEPQLIAQYVSDRYTFGKAFQQYDQLLRTRSIV